MSTVPVARLVVAGGVWLQAGHRYYPDRVIDVAASAPAGVVSPP